MKKKTAVLLHNVRSAYNVGAIFRTAEGAGILHLYLSGYTPTPHDRFGRVRKDVVKTALGAEQLVPWSHTKQIGDAFKKIRGGGWYIVAVEQALQATDYRMFRMTRPTCFVFGNEVRGLSLPVLERCDAVIEIPMCGVKESLNVAVAAGVVLFSRAM